MYSIPYNDIQLFLGYWKIKNWHFLHFGLLWYPNRVWQSKITLYSYFTFLISTPVKYSFLAGVKNFITVEKWHICQTLPYDTLKCQNVIFKPHMSRIKLNISVAYDAWNHWEYLKILQYTGCFIYNVQIGGTYLRGKTGSVITLKMF